MYNSTPLAPGFVPDRFGRIWPAGTEVCPECGQPDNCGDCSHDPLTADDAAYLGATPCRGFSPTDEIDR